MPFTISPNLTLTRPLDLQILNPMDQVKQKFAERSDETPVLLLPIRLETRFMTIKHVYRHVGTATQGKPAIADTKELWVRFFPDDIAISSHEEALTADEIAAGKSYWNEVYAAGGSESNLIGTWRVVANALGATRAAYVVRKMTPTNYSALTKTFTGSPIYPAVTTKAANWTAAASSFVLPDRFVAVAYRGTATQTVVGKVIPDILQVGLEPSDTTTFVQENGSLTMPDGLEWMTDFKEAEKIGMAVRFKLDGIWALGMTRLVVVGLMLGNSEDVSQDLLTQLIDHQRFTSGFAFVPQGTPTNNTEQVSSGWDASALSVDTAFANERGAAKVAYVASATARTDGQWFADAIGLDYETVAYTDKADGKDISEAMAMNRALWPATLQFGLRQMMHPLFSDTNVRSTENFFKAWVTGRGQIPAFRIGNQPYGVVPATAFSKWEYNSLDIAHGFHKKLLPILQSMNTQWDALAAKVKTVTGTDITSLDGKFMEILGLHPSSVTFYQRFAAGPEVLYGLESFYSSLSGGAFATQRNSVDGLSNLNSTGLTLTKEPFAATVVTPDTNRKLTGPVIDTVPLSETEPIQPLKGSTKNYLNWLINATHSALRNQTFTNVQADADCPAPKALLYLFLRHSLLLEYANTAFDLMLSKGLVANGDRFLEDYSGVGTHTMTISEKITLRTNVENDILKRNGFQITSTGSLISPLSPTTTFTRSTEISNLQLDIDAEYTRQMKVIEQGPTNWADTNAIVSQISSTLSVGAYIDGLAVSSTTKAALKDVRDALTLLEKVPTARLERLLAEHLDLCSYRLDAWKNGLIQKRLIDHRKLTSTTRKKGIHLGAYGWLENLNPGTLPGIEVKEAVRKSGALITSTASTDFSITEALAFDASSIFTYLGTDTTVPLVLDAEAKKVRPAPRLDSGNQGYVHTPSINHAATAAILRAGYNADPTDAMAINLNSQRVRTALFYMEGVRNGQELGALLGYRYERGMHDLGLKDAASAFISLESYLVQMRAAYPLVAGSVVSTGTGSAAASEARNVMDGLKAIETYRKSGETGFLAKVTVTDLTVRAALVLLIQQLADELDALGDLGMAEAVFQLAQGRKERADAVMRALNGEGTFPDIEIVNTPRTGKSLMHRVVLHLDGPNPKHNYWTAASLLANCEPRLNPFVGQQLGDPTKLCFNVTLEITEASGVTTKRCKVRLEDLGLQPLHFLLLVGRQLDQPNATALNQRIEYAARTKFLLRDDGTLKISFSDRTGFNTDDRSLSEVIAHLEGILDVLRRTRHLRPEDLLLPGAEVPSTGGYDLAELKGRLTYIRGVISPYGALFMLKSAQTAITTAATSLRAGLTVARMNALRTKLLDVHPFSIEGTIPVNFASNTAADATALLEQSDQVVLDLQALYDAAHAQFLVADTVTDPELCITALQGVAKLLFGKDFLLLPTFTQRDGATFAAAKTYADGTGLLAHGGDFPMEEWLQGISRVRPAMADLLRMSVMSEGLHGQDRLPALRPLQLPHTVDNVGAADAKWVGIAFPETYAVPGDVLSLVNSFPTGYVASARQAGLVLDEWSESIPDKNATTGLAMHVNQPNSKPPQSLLLCVTPKETGQWNWDTLLEIVNETLDAAKQRAVDPNIVDTSIYAQFLPMLYASLTAPAGFPTLDFARNISTTFKGIFESMAVMESPALLTNLKLMD